MSLRASDQCHWRGNPYSFWNDFVNVTDHHGRQTAAEKRRHYTFRTKSYPFRSINRCSAVAKIEVFLRLNYVNRHCRRCAPGGVWGGGFDCGSNQLKPSPAGFFGSFLAGTRKLPSGGTAPTAPPKGIVFGAKGSPTPPVIASQCALLRGNPFPKQKPACGFPTGRFSYFIPPGCDRSSARSVCPGPAPSEPPARPGRGHRQNGPGRRPIPGARREP